MTKVTDVGVVEAIQSLIRVQASFAAHWHLQLVKRHAMTSAEAAASLREAAAEVGKLTLAAPPVGSAIVAELLDYAASFDGWPVRETPKFELLPGGLEHL